MTRMSLAIAALAFVSTAAFATTSDIDINVHDVGIYQAQDGFDLNQRAAIANVTDQYTGNTNIYVHHAKIYQKQKGQGGKQTATIATICAECTSAK